MASAQIKAPLIRLFDPGFGGEPPYLAGREKELDTLLEGAEFLHEGRSPPMVVMHGPRGNGKTVLVNIVRRRFEKEIPGVRIRHCKAVSLKDLESLCEALLPQGAEPPGFLEKLGRRVTGVKLGPLGLSVDPQGPRKIFSPLLQEVTKESPLIMMIDEAHILDNEVGHILLNAASDAREGNWPFYLILAGTPGLITRLNQMHATFWDCSEDLPIGLLDRIAAGQALTEPLKGRGIAFTPGALADVVHRCSGYPYFVQVWGKSLTRVLNDDKTVTAEHVEKASAEADRVRRAYYRKRHEELDRQNLLEVADALSRAYRQRAGGAGGEFANLGIPLNELRRIIGPALGGGADHAAETESLNELVNLGYIWRETENYQAGVPSLMDYISERAAPQAQAQ